MNDLGNDLISAEKEIGESLEIRVLGPLRLDVASPDAPLGRIHCSEKEASFVAYLAITGREHSREALAELFWPERSPDQSLGNLRVLLSRLRKKLGDFLRIERQTVGWVDGRVWIDLRDLETALDDLEKDPAAARLTQLNGISAKDLASGLKAGESVALEDWLNGQRATLSSRVAEARRLLLEIALSRQDFDSALALSTGLLKTDPHDEEACRHAMRLLARSGRRAEALACFERCREALGEDLGIQPEDETLALVAELGTPTAMPEAHVPVGRLAARTRRLLLDRLERFWIEQVLETAIPPDGPFQLLERSRPDWLDSPWADLGNRPEAPVNSLLPAEPSPLKRFEALGSAMLVAGPPGGGKTFRLLELARDAAGRARTDTEAPLPVVLHLGSWTDEATNEAEDLATWVGSELRNRYHLPRGVTAEWLVDGGLLLLLDGLDELEFEVRKACVEAINRSRRSSGLSAVAVCCRRDAYQELVDEGVRLRLDAAVELQPLSPWQVDEYFAQASDEGSIHYEMLARAFSEDSGWRELLANPLMLSLASDSTLGDTDSEPPLDSESASPGDDLRRRVVGDYVDRMLSRGSEDSDSSLHWLRGLARGMRSQHLGLFQIEALQPSWLASPRARLAYFLASRCVTVSAIGCLMLLVGAVMKVDLQTFSVILSATVLGSLLLLGVDALRLRLEAGVRLPWWARAVLTIGCALLLALSGMAIARGFGQHPTYGPALFASTFSSLLVWRSRRVTWRHDVVPVSALAWSLRRALRGLAAGALGGAVLGILLYSASMPEALSIRGLAGAAIGPMVALGIISAILVGLHEVPAGEIDRPNVGMRVSLRSAAFGAFMMSVGLSFGLLASFRILRPLLQALGIQPFFALRQSAIAPDQNVALAIAALFGGYAFLWYGGLETLKHAVLRLCLWRSGSLPLRIAPFLKKAAKMGLLRHQGTGTIFRHRAVLDWLAGVDEGASRAELASRRTPSDSR